MREEHTTRRAFPCSGVAALVVAGLAAAAAPAQPADPGSVPPGASSSPLVLPGGVSVDMVRIPSGSFTMGSPDAERGRSPNESPRHQVTISRAFDLGRTEVTQAQWRAVMGTAAPTSCGSYGVGDAYPVYCVSWNDIAGPGGFIEKLNQQLGTTKYRLPSEAEWEYAARGGTTAAFSFTTPSDWNTRCESWPEAKTHMWWCNNAGTASHPVGGKDANPLGLRDMHGNIAEWVQDVYHATYDGAPTDGSAWGGTGTSRVYRGGYWAAFAHYCRSATRNGQGPEYRGYPIGFRVAASTEEEVPPTVTSISPSVAPNTTTDAAYFAEPLLVTVTGTGFKNDTGTRLTLASPSGDASPTATITAFEGCSTGNVCTTIRASLRGFAGLAEGSRHVVVANPSGKTGTGAGLFFVSSLVVAPLEVNQALPDKAQECTPSRPCVARHNTAVRVRVTCNGSRCAERHPALTGRLHVKRDGQPIPGSPFAPTDNPNIAASARSQASLQVRATGAPYASRDRRMGLDALSFVFASNLGGALPAPGGDHAALEAGGYELAFEVDPRSSGTPPATTTAPDALTHLVRRRSGLSFAAAPPKGSLHVAVLVEGNNPTEVLDVLSRFAFLRASYPTDPGLVTFRYFSSNLAYPSLTPGFKNMHIRKMFTRLREWWIELARREPDYVPDVIAFFSTAVAEDDGAGVSDCLDVPPAGWRCDSPTSYLRLPEPRARGRVEKTLAHEVGHHLGLGDTYADGLVSPVNPPGAACYDNGCTVEDKAFDSLLHASSAPEPRLQDPDDALWRDFMGNAGREISWIDRRTWDYLYGRLVAGTASTPAIPLAATVYVTVGGLIGKDGSAQIDTVRHSSAPLASTPPSGTTVLELQGANGQALASRSFEPSRRLVHVEQPFHASFLVSLPLDAATRRLVLREGTRVLATREVSARAPTVRVTSPNGGGSLSGQVAVTWTASDPDGDPLTFSVLIDPDDGPVVPLALGLTGTSFSWNTALSPATASGRVVVVASDGFHEAEDASDAPFAVTASGPLVAIVSPPDGARLTSGQTAVVEGAAWSQRDGELADTALAWRSSRDGAVGRGRRVAVRLSAGTHVLTLSATDSRGTAATTSITVTVGAGAGPLTASLQANPAAGTAPLAVTLTATAGGGVPPYEVSWGFGDGTVADGGLSRTHTYATPGLAEATVTVTDCQHARAEASATVTVAAPQENVRYLVPAAAHAPGKLGTQWLTDLVLHNPAETGVSATISLLERDRDNTAAAQRTFPVPWGASLPIADVVLDSFGADNLAGALHIGASGPLVVSSRTYNDAPSGTYGQYVPGTPEAGAVGAGQEVRLIQLTRNASYRTNVGLASFASASTAVKVTVFKGDGTKVGERSYTLGSRGVTQTTDLVGALGATDVADAYATVRSDTPGARYLAYASVVDNRTGDPVQVNPAATSSGPPLYLPAAAHVQGFGGSRWRTDLEVHNPGTVPATFSVELLRRGATNTSPTSKQHTLAAGRAVRFDDVLASQFAFDGAATLRVTPTAGTVAAMQRTYNDQPAGTYGQGIAALPLASAVAFGQTARLVQLSQSASDTSGFRTNLGVVNATAANLAVVADLYRGNGTFLGSRSYALPPYGYVQEDRVFRTVTTGEVGDGFAVLRTTTPGGRFFAYASVADNRSGDPITVAAVTLGEAACQVAISPGSRSHGAGAETGSVAVTTGAGCPWTATAGATWVHVTSGASGTGSGTVGYRVDANPGSTSRLGTITISGQTFGITQAAAGAPNEVTVTLPGGVPLVLVRISAGTFTMGSPLSEHGREADEGPAHAVTLSRDYYIGKTEVTRRQWEAVMGTPLPPTCALGWAADDLPVACVDWDDVCGGATGSTCAASSFVGRLNAALGTTELRLPTEAEWEKAARGGTTTAFSFATPATWETDCGSFPEAEPRMWWCGNSGYAFHPVAMKQANPYGLHDVHGNAWELVGDWYDGGYFGVTPATDPPGPATGVRKVTRGGGQEAGALHARSANRGNVTLSTFSGFRIARSIGAQPCIFAVAPPGRSHAAAADTGTVAVMAGAGCAWTATSSAAWLTLTAGASGTASGTVTYAVAANPSATPRTATLTVAGHAVTVRQEAPASQLSVTLPGNVPLVLLRIPAGTFTMGAPSGEIGNDGDEGPPHTVTLSRDFYLGRTEVTQRQWEAVMGTIMPTSCVRYGLGPDHPAYCVSWDDVCGGATGSTCTATSFIGRLNTLAGTTKFRLPTEAEWERAARGGTTTAFSFANPGDWFNGCGAFAEAEPFMWWCGNAGGESHQVATRKANPYGLFDMHGNVWEWVADWYDKAAYATSPGTDPAGPATGTRRVSRGGDWNEDAKLCRSANRGNNTPDSRSSLRGFRVARSP